MEIRSQPISNVGSRQVGSRRFALSGRDRLLRWLILGTSLAPVIGSVLYNQGVRLTPAKCFFQAIIGFPSPGCGMTRSLMAIARGDLSQALMYHAFGPLVFAACLLAAGQMAIEVGTGRSLHLSYRSWLVQPWVGVLGSLAFVGYYALRLHARYDGTLPLGLTDSAVWQFVVEGAKAL